MSYEYKVDGVSDEWTPAASSARWEEAVENALDLLLVTEVAFTLGTSGPDLKPVVIRYRKAEQ